MKRITYKVEINGFEMIYTSQATSENNCFDNLIATLRKETKISKLNVEEIPVSFPKNILNRINSIL